MLSLFLFLLVQCCYFSYYSLLTQCCCSLLVWRCWFSGCSLLSRHCCFLFAWYCYFLLVQCCSTLLLFLLFLVCSTLFLFLLLLVCLTLTLFNIVVLLVALCLLDIDIVQPYFFLVAPYLLDVTRRYCSSFCCSLFNVASFLGWNYFFNNFETLFRSLKDENKFLNKNQIGFSKHFNTQIWWFSKS